MGKAAAPKVDPILAAVDELGALEKQLAPWKAKISRADALRKMLRGAFETSPATESFERRAKLYGAIIGARANERHIDEPKLIELAGLKAYAKHAHMTLGALEEHFAAEVATMVVSLKPTGSRKLTTFEIGRAA